MHITLQVYAHSWTVVCFQRRRGCKKTITFYSLWSVTWFSWEWDRDTLINFHISINTTSGACAKGQIHARLEAQVRKTETCKCAWRIKSSALVLLRADDQPNPFHRARGESNTSPPEPSCIIQPFYEGKHYKCFWTFIRCLRTHSCLNGWPNVDVLVIQSCVFLKKKKKKEKRKEDCLRTAT